MNNSQNTIKFLLRKRNIFLSFVLILTGITCVKPPKTCSKFGYEYSYTKPSVNYQPGLDSIPLGTSLTLEANAPKNFFDEEKHYDVSLHENTIFGPLGIIKATNNVDVWFTGAIEDMELTALTGSIVRDSIQFSPGQLKSFRTAYWDRNNSDSFHLKIVIKPKVKGTFFVNLGQQSNRDADCALYKYFLKVSNTDQHLYLLAQANNGYIDDYSRNYAYCFRVY